MTTTKLTQADRIAVSHLAHYGAMAESNMTSVASGTLYWKTVDRLFAAGLARRAGLDQHGRKLVELTDQGRAVA